MQESAPSPSRGGADRVCEELCEAPVPWTVGLIP